MRVLGWFAMVAAIVAIVVGLVAAVGIWIVRPDLQARVEEMLVTADDGLVRAGELLDRTSATVTVASDAVTRIDAAAQSVAAEPVIDDQTRADLAGGIERFMAGPYADLQASYAGLQESVGSISRTLSLVDRMLPGISLPGNLAETLTQVDDAVTQLDATISDGAGLVTETLTGPSPASRIAAHTQRLSATLDAIEGALPTVDERLVDAQERVVVAQERLDTWFLVLSVVVTLLGLYLAGLNVLLYQKGRAWAGR